MASRSVNRVILLGHLGRDAETAYTASQVAVTKFSVATSRRWQDKQSGEWKEDTNWANVVLWGGEKVAPYLTKGTQVYIEGRIQTRSYDDRDGKKVWATDVIAQELILLGSKDGQRQQESADSVCIDLGPPPSRRVAQHAQGNPPAGQADDDDDLPF